MTYREMNKLIRERIENTRIKYRTSDMPLEEYLNRVAQLIESRTGFIELNRAGVLKLSFDRLSENL